jgi:hypothetical protein
MGSVLIFLGVAALMAFGLVVLLTALTFDAPVKPDRPRDQDAAREQRPHRKQRPRRAHNASTRDSAIREWAVTLRGQAIALADEWWPRLRHHARDVLVQRLTLDSTTGQVIAAAAASVVAAYLVVTLG